MTKTRLPNGGGVILMRALMSSVLLFLLTIGLLDAIDPAKTWQFSQLALREQVIQRVPWYGAIFAGIYTLLYARFAAQWSYLANLYNSIKREDVRAGEQARDNVALAQWKAGFIEDAHNLHLVCKDSLAPIIRDWGNIPCVKEQFYASTPGGKPRLDWIMQQVTEAVRVADEKQKSKYRQR